MAHDQDLAIAGDEEEEEAEKVGMVKGGRVERRRRGIVCNSVIS